MTRRVVLCYVHTMSLDEYLTGKGRGAVAQVQRESGLSYPLLRRVRLGECAIETLSKARDLSRATGGSVPVEAVWGPAVRGEAVLR